MCGKSELRRQLRNRRKALSADYRKTAQRKIEGNLFRLLKMRRGSIALYQSMGSEVDLSFWIKKVRRLRPKIVLYRPLYYPFKKKMHWVPLSKKLSHRPGEQISVNRLDWVLIPILGVDFQGNRLGQGGGYYDASLRTVLLKNSPKKIAVGFDCQLVESLPCELHDVTMNAFISETKRLFFG
ncbi:MAG: 5-formyltetrahydrofolate cyclo-ligase [Neisseriaceae bacterium]